MSIKQELIAKIQSRTVGVCGSGYVGLLFQPDLTEEEQQTVISTGLEAVE